MTIADILSPILRRLGYDQSDLDNDAALAYDVMSCVNDAIEAILAAGEWEFLRTTATVITVAAQETVNLPTDFGTLQPLAQPYYINGNSGKLRAASSEELASLRSATSAANSGQPLRYQLIYSPSSDAAQLSFWPIPDGAYSITVPYIRKIAQLVDTSIIPPIPEVLHSTLRLGTLVQAEKTFGLPTDSRDDFARRLAEAWAKYGSTDKGQRSGRLSAFGEDDLDELDMVIQDVVTVKVTP